MIYLRETLKNLDPRNLAEKDRLIKRLKIQLTKDVVEAREKLIIPPWKGDLESLIATELAGQLVEISDKDFTMEAKGIEPVIVELNYGLFALKYINHQKAVRNGQVKGAEVSAK